ncbi:hypothetical protein HMPREF1018_04897, partial [Bacteroides fragilis]
MVCPLCFYVPLFRLPATACAVPEAQNPAFPSPCDLPECVCTQLPSGRLPYEAPMTNVKTMTR